ncbi:Uma2 family endonuclease [Candidatus Parabeggiatoa sp. HSG14]|uniref:Uma2 family endonuclease n=1 Tax=Candidatus Parabeggiatoa sp. HSG14 TaxID=3055593 RepID=UPI0025A78F9D|nr:Uma2 family endonuclease [Thiotrichales bacterium HSG14]
MQINLNQIEIPPGQSLWLHGIDWQTFEQFLAETGDERHSRVLYDSGILELMAPSPVHEKSKSTFNCLVEAFFEELDIENQAGGSTTFKNKKMEKCIEPDECFYLGEHATTIGWEDSGIPDLAIDADKTSSSLEKLKGYEKLGVPEVWIYDVNLGDVKIYNGISVVQESLYMPSKSFDKIKESVQAIKEGKSNNAVKREFRKWVREMDAKKNLKALVEEKLDKAFNN